MSASTAVRPQTRPVAAAARAVMLALVGTLTLIATGDPAQLWWIALLAVAGAPALLAPEHRLIGPLSRLAEAVVIGLAASQVAVSSTLGSSVGGLGASAVLPYLAVPVTVTALRRQFREGAVLLGVTAATLVVAGGFTEVDGGRQLGQPGYLAVCAQWLILAGLGLYAAGTLHQVMRVRAEGKPQPYAEATRLLTQLRTVARQLPGATLDPGGISEHLLEELRTVAPVNRGAVLSASGGGRLVVLAQIGVDRVDWETTLDSDSAIADAWASQQPQTAARSQARSHTGGDVSSLIVPLVAGVRTVGLVVLEADAAHAYPPPVVSRVTALTGPAALRLEAALLFDDVRSLATNEERQRLAREIHDGVAQELVIV
ncbi:GAF domain-containing protein, partial [Streptomyces microflavus]|uniref:GAF domain-containing protein n=1 Tax=Streptomyces microflavus TaxID=1919 RepID=UPI0033CE4C85